MSQSDPIADFITVIRNGVRSRKTQVEVPFSKIKAEIARILADEGFIDGWETFEVTNHKGNKFKYLRVALRYADELKTVSPISQLERISKPGRRVYTGHAELPKVQGGLGVAVVSTSQGVVTDRQARKLQVGGEVLCEIW